MNQNQLSFLDPKYLYRSPFFNHRCYFEGWQFLQHTDLKSLHPSLPPAIPVIRIPDRRLVLDRLLERIAGSELCGKQEFKEYLLHKYRRNCKASTLKMATTCLFQFLSFYQTTAKLNLEQLTRQDIEAFVEHMQDRGLKPNSVHSRLRGVYAFVHFLVEKKVLGYELMERKITVKLAECLPRAIDPEHLQRLLSVVDNGRDRALILLLLRTGMRIGELLHTKVRDVELKDKKILIHQADKTEVGRVVYYSEDAHKALLAWFKIRNPSTERLFYGQGRQSLGYEGARGVFRKYLQKADLEHSGYTLHCLRHSFATELLNAGMRLECLQVLLGHSNLEITRRYARLTDKTREKEYFKAMRRIEKGEFDADD
jgi:site-specific recombinase XerD